jgi:hypothetical protein
MIVNNNGPTLFANAVSTTRAATVKVTIKTRKEKRDEGAPWRTEGNVIGG